MIPALPGPAIRHRPEQFQQVIADFGDYGRRGRLTISTGNGRLDHGEAPGMTRIFRKTSGHTGVSSCFPQIRRTRSHQRILSRDARRKPATLNDLETSAGRSLIPILKHMIC